MRRIFRVMTALLCAILLAVPATPGFAADIDDYIAWYDTTWDMNRKQGLEERVKLFQNKDLLEVRLSRYPANTAENLAAAEDCIRECLFMEDGAILRSTDLTIEQKNAILSGEKELSITLLPAVPCDELYCYKEGEGITAEDIRKSVYWLCAIAVDGEYFAEGAVEEIPDDEFLRYMDEHIRKMTGNPDSYYMKPGFQVSSLGVTKSRAEEVCEEIAAAAACGEVYQLYSGYARLDGDRVIYYEDLDSLTSGAPMSRPESRVYEKAVYLRQMAILQDEADSYTGLTTSWTEAMEGQEKMALKNFYPEAFKILYGPWIIAWSVILGLAVVGTVVLVIVKKRKTAK